MFKVVYERIKESFLSIGPFFLVILILHFSGLLMIGSTVNVNGNIFSEASIFQGNFYSDYYGKYVFSPALICFLIAFPLMVLGMSFYGIGADNAVDKMGAAVGSSLTKKKSIILLFIVSALLGGLCTFAEPDLTVFSTQLMGEGGKYVIISIVSLGVGLLLGLAFIRIIFQWSYKIILYIIFLIAFGLGILINRESFFPIVFDGMGVTIGSITVPFVLSMGIAVAQLRGGKNAEDDSFGLNGLASLGPIITIFLWAKITTTIGFDAESLFGSVVSGSSGGIGPMNYASLGSHYLDAFISSITDVGIAILPLIVFFLTYNFIFLKLSLKELEKIFIGLVETFLGLTVFMVGINSGFMIVARQLGVAFSSTGFQDHFYVVILLCILIGTLIILAEPAVHVLCKQVEEVSRGSIGIKELYGALCVAVCAALLFGILKVQFRIDITVIIIPLLLLFFILTLFVPNIYTGLALDSAGIASSTMASAFLLPMEIAMFVAKYPTASAEETVRYGTGMVGLVYICPLLAIEILGVYGKVKSNIVFRINQARIIEADDKQVIHLENNEPLSY